MFFKPLLVKSLELILWFPPSALLYYFVFSSSFSGLSLDQSRFLTTIGLPFFLPLETWVMLYPTHLLLGYLPIPMPPPKELHRPLRFARDLPFFFFNLSLSVFFRV